MSSEEDTELRDLVQKTLERAGVLGRIKAELRASVFLALEDDDRWMMKRPNNFDLIKFTSEPSGKTALGLVREFMEFFKMDFTLSVFDEEVRPETCMSRAELIKDFQIQDIKTDLPIISHLLQGSEQNSLKTDRSEPKIQDGQTRSDDGVKKSQFSTNEVIAPKSFELDQIRFEPKTGATVSDSISSVYDPFFDDPLPPASTVDSIRTYDKDSIFGTKDRVPEESKIFGSSLSFQNKLDSYSVSKGENESVFDENTKNKHLSDTSVKRDFLKEDTPFPSLVETNKDGSLSSLKDLPSLTSKPSTLSSKSAFSWAFPNKLTQLSEQDSEKRSNESREFSHESSTRSMIKSLVQDAMQSSQGDTHDNRGAKNDTFGALSSREASIDAKFGDFLSQDGNVNNDSSGELSIKSGFDSIISHPSDENEENSGSELSVRSRLESFLPDLSLDKNDLEDSHNETEQSIEEEIDDELLSSLSVGGDTTNDETVSHVSSTGCDYAEPLNQKN